MEYKFNINNYVRVKLNDDGYQHIINHYAALEIKVTKDQLLNKTHADGYYPMQMHSFMSMFGDVPIFAPTHSDVDIIFSSNDL